MVRLRHVKAIVDARMKAVKKFHPTTHDGAMLKLGGIKAFEEIKCELRKLHAVSSRKPVFKAKP